ncbi:MAG: TraR/DksA C4-type zinc finger protein [Proteobacteria bacterium]|nr:TraR/DksA C4-type zinc finger protein [Pseudomonadota bacterium]
MDQFDRAQKLDAFYRTQALSRRKRLPEPTMTITTTCTDCDEEIPEGRRLAAPGCVRCRDCQQQWELHTR